MSIPIDIPVGDGMRVRMKEADGPCTFHELSDDEAAARFSAWYQYRKRNWATVPESPANSLNICVDCVSRVKARAGAKIGR